MELLSTSFQTKIPAAYWMKPLGSRATFPYIRFIIRSKKSKDQDFQEYAKPSRLLPATKAKVCTDASVEKAIDSLQSGRFESLYNVKLQTSKISGSGLTAMNSGILLCLIDENGSSILQRLPAIFTESDSRSKDKAMRYAMHFQRGSIDEFAFKGPNLGRIAAVWVGLESGQWRIAGLSLIVIHESPPSSAEENQETKQLTGLQQYTFEFDDVLLGDSSEFSMMEFRPHLVTTVSGDASTLFNTNSVNSSQSLDSTLASNEESMKEYRELKFSILLYDAVLILVGSFIASSSTGENATYAFLTGGLCGFFYLLLLQKSVDGLEVPELTPSENKGSFGRLSGLAFVIVAVIAAVKYSTGEDDGVKLTAKEIIFGMMGFLMCKVSVVLAAFRTVPLLGSRENNKQKV